MMSRTLQALFLVVTTSAAKEVPVTFRVDMSLAKAASSGVYVSVIWPPPGKRLTDPDGDGIYEITVDLTVGKTYEYKFRNGKHSTWDGPGWEDALNKCGRGQYDNRFFTVKPGENKLAAVCFNSCNLCEKASNTGFVCQDPKASNFKRDKDGSFECHYWDLLYADEFAGDKLQRAVWQPLVLAPRAFNNELQSYTDSTKNAYVKDGQLTIEVIHSKKNGNSAYSSARLVTQSAVDFLYGRVDVRAKLPAGKGTWPAIWMLPSENTYGSWPASGEIDIMEMVGKDLDVVHGTVHTGAYNHIKNTQKGGSIRVPGSSTSYHVYSVVWTADHVTFLVDDVAYHRFNNEKTGQTDKWPFNHKHHIILNVAMGGMWGGPVDDSIFATGKVTMDVDFVRVYRASSATDGGGCTDRIASNYDSNAKRDDASCLYASGTKPTDNGPADPKRFASGCIDSTAKNYDSEAKFGRQSFCDYGCNGKSTVTFEVDMSASPLESKYTQITINGDWHGYNDNGSWRWHGMAVPLSKVGSSHIWRGSKAIPIGRHFYKIYATAGWSADQGWGKDLSGKTLEFTTTTKDCTFLVSSCGGTGTPCVKKVVSPYEPCKGKEDGSQCKLCAPDDEDCMETSELKACQKGKCVAKSNFIVGASYCTHAPNSKCYKSGHPACCTKAGEECPEKKPACDVVAYDPCKGKEDGSKCKLCAADDEDCVETSVPKVCEKGKCVEAKEPIEKPIEKPEATVNPCAKKECGAECRPGCPKGVLCDMPPANMKFYCSGDKKCTPDKPMCKEITSTKGDKAGVHAPGAGGLRLRSQKATIELGPKGDVKLIRSNPGTLAIDADISVSGSIDVKTLKVNGLSLDEYIRGQMKSMLTQKQE